MRSARRPPRSCASPTCAAPKASSRSAAEARKRFWLDRARTAAIARHTNAFKINEDVVIPLERLGEYSDGIERINIELSLKNKIRLMDALEAFFSGELPLHQEAEQVSPQELLGSRVEQALALVRAMRARGGSGCSTTWMRRQRRFPRQPAPQPDQQRRVFDVLQDGTLRVSWKRRCASRCSSCSPAARSSRSAGSSRRSIERVLKSRVFVALHMHAGDGNVHTNIPVNSDDYAMLQEANQVVARVMRWPRRWAA